MKVHNLYSDLLVSLANYINKILDYDIKGIEYNLGNVTYQTEKKTSVELPRMLVNFENATVSDPFPYMYQFETDNINKILVIYNKTKDLEFYIQESLYNITVSISINFDRDYASVFKTKHIIENYMPINAYMHYFDFMSFLEIPNEILNDKTLWLDVYNDNINNIFFRYDNILNTNTVCFGVYYKPLIRTSSISLGDFLTDNNTRTYSINLEFEILNNMPIRFSSPRIENERPMENIKLEKTKYNIEVPINNSIIIDNDFFIPINGTDNNETVLSNDLVYFKIETINYWGEGIYDTITKKGYLENGNFNGINFYNIEIYDNNSKVSFILEIDKDVIIEGKYIEYYKINHVFSVSNCKKFDVILGGYIFSSFNSNLNQYQHIIKNIKLKGYKEYYNSEIIFFENEILPFGYFEFISSKIKCKFNKNGKLENIKSDLNIFSLILDIDLEYNNFYSPGYLSNIDIDLNIINPVLINPEYVLHDNLSKNIKNFLITDKTKFKKNINGDYELSIFENLEIIEIIPKKNFKITKENKNNFSDMLELNKNKITIYEKFFDELFSFCSHENPILIKGIPYV